MPVPVTVHSCVDGYSRRSRKILWLRCLFSNHHAGIIASYFLDCVSFVGGFPATLTTDCGTEKEEYCCYIGSVIDKTFRILAVTCFAEFTIL